jgi:hypothetical protein
MKHYLEWNPLTATIHKNHDLFKLPSVQDLTPEENAGKKIINAVSFKIHASKFAYVM